MLKLSMRCCCQPGSQALAHSGSVGRFARTSIDDGVRWKTYSCFGRRAEVRHALHRRRAGADDADALVAKPGEVPVASRRRCRRSPSGSCGTSGP